MDLISQIFGRFHPLMVHLPIGILFLAFLFECLSRFHLYKKLGSAVQSSLFIGAIFAILSVISGFFLSQEGGYDDMLLQRHQNMGIATAVFAILLYFLRLKSVPYFHDKINQKSIRILLFIPLIALLSITGHLGGSMTHGEDYLFEFAPNDPVSDPSVKFKAIADIDEAILYQDIIEPILDSKCYSCHSSKKRKGELRLDQIEFIAQGGKHGAVIKAGVPDSSTLYSRLILSLEDEHHMPPKERPQLSSSEISIIQAWIEGGASFERNVNSFSQAVKIRNYISTLITQLHHEPLIPVEEVFAADVKALNALKEKDVLIIPVGNETNYLSVSFVNARSVTDHDLQLLLPIKKQLLWLNLGRTKITDKGLKVIAQLSALRQLHLDYTAISDDGVKELRPLVELNYLNLVGTKITDRGLSHLSALKKLRNTFVYQTQVTATGLADFSANLPDVHVDIGNYSLPKLATDTIIFRRTI